VTLAVVVVVVVIVLVVVVVVVVVVVGRIKSSNTTSPKSRHAAAPRVRFFRAPSAVVAGDASRPRLEWAQMG
jgi:uncharacterized membrane protein